jgi:hypothetical protein|tara:strand:+ start:376 stop:549 length:174 start_codon:yes stop_codon:yes gene_type:complete
MTNFKAIYKSKSTIVKAESTYKAQQIAVAEFQKGQRAKVKSWDVIIMNVDVTHTADF